jgi:adenine-specific DNA-methyltransferase
LFKNISLETKKLLGNWKVCSTGHPDLYIPFFQIGLENLSSKGVLGFITMNTFFKSVNGRALRGYFKEKNYKIKIIDFGSNQIFKSKSTYTCICLIEKRKSLFMEYKRSNLINLFKNNPFEKIIYNDLDSAKGWNLNQIELLDKIENVGTLFGKLYKTRNGIATLKNNIYIFKQIDENADYFTLKKNDKIYEIEKKICKDIINPNRFAQKVNIASIMEKVIFPYFFSGDKVKLIKEDELKENYPKAYKYLQVNKEILSLRDKGKGAYENWYAYGRNQSLEKLKFKLFFPHITPNIPDFTVNTDENLLFYNGLAVITEDERELHFLKQLMSSRLFWSYIKLSSKPYGSGYYSLSRNYIKYFGVYNFTSEEKDYIISCKDRDELDTFIENKYEVRI